MSHFFTIFRRELAAYFNSAIAWIFLIVFGLFANGLFMMQFFQVGKADMRAFFGSIPFILNIFIPAIAMRLWAEDKKGNTFELLLTFPMSPQSLVFGKYFASLVFYALALATTLTLPVMISWIGSLDAGMIAAGYLGVFFLGAFFLAVGIFISGLTKDQIVAFILTMIVTFAFFFIGTDLFAGTLDGWAPGVGSFLKQTVGIASHLNSFSKGVLDLRDILFFILGIGILLFLNGLSLEGRFKPKAKIIFSGAVVVCAFLFLVSNWLFHDIAFGRFDWTQGQVYKISDVSKKILADLKTPVQIKLYISASESMPTLLKTLEREITDKLEELKVISDGKLKYRVIHLDPSDPDEETKTKLRNEGVMPFQVESVQRDEMGVKIIYSTLVIEYKEKAPEIMPRVMPQALFDMEYQLMSRIHKLSLDRKPKVAVYAPAEGSELPDELSRILEGAGQEPRKNYEDKFKTAVLLMKNNGYQVERISLSKESGIPDQTDLLLLLAPGTLSDRQRYEINKYLNAGGTVVIADQGFNFSYRQGEFAGVQAVPEKRALDINKLLEKWGVKISDEMLFDESMQVISIMSGQRIGPFALEMPVKFPNQIIIREDMINRDTFITKRLPSLVYLWGSPLVLTEATLKSFNLQATVLFTSTAKSWTLPYDGNNLTADNIKKPDGKDLTGKFPLSVLVQGQFSNTFETAPKWSEQDAEETAPNSAAAKPGRLLVVGCSQAFSEDLIRNSGNLNLFANSVDGLLLGEDLIQIRSKTPVIRDIRPVSNGMKLWFRFFSVFLIPVLLFIAALFRFFVRRKEKEFYLAALRSANS